MLTGFDYPVGMSGGPHLSLLLTIRIHKGVARRERKLKHSYMHPRLFNMKVRPFTRSHLDMNADTSYIVVMPKGLRLEPPDN